MVGQVVQPDGQLAHRVGVDRFFSGLKRHKSSANGHVNALGFDVGRVWFPDTIEKPHDRHFERTRVSSSLIKIKFVLAVLMSSVGRGLNTQSKGSRTGRTVSPFLSCFRKSRCAFGSLCETLRNVILIHPATMRSVPHFRKWSAPLSTGDAS